MPNEPFSSVYDLQDPAAWRRARRHRHYWGALHTHVTMLDADRLLLTFRPSPDPRWRAWERVRRRWILGDAA